MAITPISSGDTAASTDYAAQAQAIRTAYETELARAQDPALHPQVRQVRLARAWANASRALEDLDNLETRQSGYEIAAGDPAAWRSGADRDARERAGRVTSARVAAEIINDAAQAGDAALLAAVGHQVVRNAAAHPESDWAGVADDLLRQLRTDGTTLAERVRERQRERAAQVIVRRAHYHLSKPDDIAKMDYHAIWTLAGVDESTIGQARRSAQEAAWGKVGGVASVGLR